MKQKVCMKESSSKNSRFSSEKLFQSASKKQHCDQCSQQITERQYTFTFFRPADLEHFFLPSFTSLVSAFFLVFYVCCDCLMFSFLLGCLLFHLSFCSSFVFVFCLLSPWSVLPFSPWIFFLLFRSFLPCLFPLLSFFLPRCSSCSSLLVLSFCSSASCRKKERERDSHSSIIKPHSTDRRAGYQVSETYRISKNFHKAESCEMDFDRKKNIDLMQKSFSKTAKVLGGEPKTANWV